MGFKNKRNVKIARNVASAPEIAPAWLAEGYEVSRDKATGTATVLIKDKAISFQRADSLARGMFAVPVKFAGKSVEGSIERREYVAVGWN